MKRTKAAALLVSAATALCACPLPDAAAADKVVTKVEFESGTLTDCEFSEPITWTQIDKDAYGNPCDMTGWSGDGYVYIDRKDACAAVKVTVPEDGFYGLNVCYIQCAGDPEHLDKTQDKTQYLIVNGESQGEILFPFNSGKGWTLLPAGYAHLNKGENEIQIKSYWGYTFLDYLTVTEAPSYLTNLSPAKTPCNPNASVEARKLYTYLTSVYGKHILAGQQEYCGSHCYNKNAYETEGKPINYLESNEQEFEYIQNNTGKQPAVRGIDFLFYNTTEPYFDDAPERVIAWYKDKGGIPTVTYHWNVPIDGKDSTTAAFYVESAANGGAFTTFSATNAVKKGTWENDKINADLALIAGEFKKIQDAGVPVIFRPLHEAQGAWFWWGAEGPEACKALYRYVWDKLTNEYHLNNLIWEWTGYTYANSLDWYPGDEYVDLIGYDKYNAVNYQPNPSAISATFYSLVSQTEGAKMVAMSENDTIPSLDNLLDANAGWLYFCPWYGNYLTDLTAKDELKKIYNSDYCITLDELPDWDTYDPELPEQTTTSQGDNPKVSLLGDADCNGEVNVLDAVLTARVAAEDTECGITDEGKINADCDGKPGVAPGDLARLLRYLAGQMTEKEFQKIP